MAAGATYEPIATTTLGSSQATVTFSSISGYTDLVIVTNPIITGATALNLQMYFNADNAGTSYSFTRLTGNGSAASGDRVSNYPTCVLSANVKVATTYGAQFNINIFNYSNTTTNKTALCRSNNASVGTDAIVNLWRSTAAITSVTLQCDSGVSFASGSIFSIYGIAAA
jgi:hypothetical protein